LVGLENQLLTLTPKLSAAPTDAKRQTFRNFVTATAPRFFRIEVERLR
jgi:hypothetical protein